MPCTIETVMNMNYIQKTSYGIKIAKRQEEITYPLGLVQYLNQLCLEELTTFEGRMQALKKLYHKKNNVPIYINPSLCFFYLEPIRNLEVIIINIKKVQRIQGYCDDSTTIYFIDGSMVNVPYDENHVLKRFSDTKHFLKRLEPLC